MTFPNTVSLAGVHRLTFWRAVFWVLMAGAHTRPTCACSAGWARSTNLSDQFPWGLWIGFDVLCGVGLAAGGFTLVAVVHIFNIERFKPILRPAILTAFLGYVLVIVALMFDLGRPDRIWHPLVMWNPHSVMFEVAWCVMLYTTVLALEFVPAVFERLGWKAPLNVLRAISIPLVILGVILSTLHQSSLGSLYPDRAGEAPSAVVHAAAAGAVLHLGDLRGPGHDDLRILALQPRIRPAHRDAAAVWNGAPAGGPAVDVHGCCASWICSNAEGWVWCSCRGWKHICWLLEMSLLIATGAAALQLPACAKARRRYMPVR